MSAIRAALAANIAVTYQSLGFSVSPYLLSTATAPGFQIAPFRLDYHGTLGDSTGMEVRTFVVFAYVSYNTDVAAQDALDQLLTDKVNVSDPMSVREALESDQHLTSRLLPDGSIVTGQPAAASDVTARFAADYRLSGLAGGQELVVGCEWTVDVRT